MHLVPEVLLPKHTRDGTSGTLRRFESWANLSTLSPDLLSPLYFKEDCIPAVKVT